MNRRWAVLALVFVGILISYVDRGNLSIAAAPMMRDFQISPATMGMLLSAFFWTYALFQIPAGAIVDRIGIRWVYAGAFLIWSLASASIALSRGPGDVVLMRMVLGLAEAAGPIASLSFIRQNFRGREQGLPTAIYIAGQNVGPAVGALLGTLIMASLGWRAMFAITGIAALLWLPWWIWLAPASRARPVESPQADQSRPAAKRHEWPVRALLSNRAVWAMSVCIFLSSYYWYFVLTWVPTYLTESRGFSTLEMGRILSTPLFVMAVLNIFAGSLADRMAARVGSVFRVRILFAVISYAGAGAILLLPVLPNRSTVLPILVVSMCSVGIGNTNYWAISQHAPPEHMVGRTIGFLNTISQIAGATAPLVTGWILGPQEKFGLAIVVAGLCSLLASGCLLVASPKGLEQIRYLLSGKTFEQQPVRD
jgi:ACS family D-galactonate transporter-like MFS transporter